MAPSNRAAIIAKAHKVLKKHYKPIGPTGDRALLDHLLFALCLENSNPAKAEAAFVQLRKGYFDWNEVRVTTVTELAETFRDLHEPAAAAGNLRRALQSIFESQYSFDLEGLKKQNLGKAVAVIEKIAGVTPFAVAYVTQHGLGGHAVPLDRGSIQVLHIIGAVSDAEAEKMVCPGMERAIPKNKGIEFGSLLHQLGADLLASPFGANVRNVLLEIEPSAKDRLPKRSDRKAVKESAEEPPPAAAEAPAEESAKPAVKSKPPAAAPPEKKKAAKEPAKEKPKPAKKKPAEKKSAGKQLARRKPR